MKRKQQCWTGKQKTAVILQLIPGRTRLVDICREHNLDRTEVGNWVHVFLAAGEHSLNNYKQDV